MPDFKTSFEQSLQELSNDIFLKKKDSPFDSYKPPVEYVDPSLTDIYKDQKGFNPMGFNPTDPTNYDRWIAKETFGSAWDKAWNGFGYSFNNTFTDYWKQYGRMFNALVNWDWNKINLNESQLIEQDFQDRLNSNKNFVFAEKGTEDDIFTKKTMAEFISNAGFMAGTTAGLFLELAVDAAITIGTAGGGFGAVAAKWGGKTAGKTIAKEVGKEVVEEVVEQTVKQAAKKGALWQGLSDFGKGYNVTAQMSKHEIIAAADDIIKGTRTLKTPGSTVARETANGMFERLTLNMGNVFKSKTFAEGAGNLAKGLPVVGNVFRYGEKIAAGAEAGLSTMQLAGVGFSGFRRVAQELNMAGTEASFEAVGAFGETMRGLIEEHQNIYGTSPDAETFNQMKEYAMQSAGANYNTNLAILLATNHVQFGNIWNRFTPSVKWAQEILQEQGLKNLAISGIKKGITKPITTIYRKGLFGTAGALKDITKDYGIKTAMGTVGKSFLRSATKFEVLEGLQEMIQETSNSAWSKYYISQMSELKRTIADSFEEGAGEQWSKQGLKVFLMGAFTGTMMRGPMHLGQVSVEKLQQIAQDRSHIAQGGTKETTPWRVAEKQQKENVKTLNELFYKMATEEKFDFDIAFNTIMQLNNATGMMEAAVSGREYEYRNNYNSALLSGTLMANQANVIDAYINAIKDVGMNMTDAEFKDNMGVDIKDTKYSSVKDFANKVANEVKEYSDIVDKYRLRVRNTTDDMLLKQGFQYKEFYTEPLFRRAQDEVIKIFAINEIKSTDAAKRAKNVMKDFTSISGVGATADWIFRSLSSVENIESEIGILTTELKQIEKQLADPNIAEENKKPLREQKRNKIVEANLLNEWKSYYVLDKDKSFFPTEEEIKEGKREKRIYNFKGVERTEIRQDENGTQQSVKEYKDNDEEVINSFIRIINLKNKQAGNNIEISNVDAIRGARYIADYFKLDKDARDYMNAVALLHNPAEMKVFIERVQEGIFKYYLNDFVENKNDIINSAILNYILTEIGSGKIELTNIAIEDLVSNLANSVIEEIDNNDAIKELMIIINSDEFGLKNSKRANELLKEIEKLFKEDSLTDIIEKKINEILDKYKKTEPEQKEKEGAEDEKEEQEEKDRNKELLDKYGTQFQGKISKQDKDAIFAFIKKLTDEGKDIEYWTWNGAILTIIVQGDKEEEYSREELENEGVVFEKVEDVLIDEAGTIPTMEEGQPVNDLQEEIDKINERRKKSLTTFTYREHKSSDMTIAESIITYTDGTVEKVSDLLDVTNKDTHWRLKQKINAKYDAEIEELKKKYSTEDKNEGTKASDTTNKGINTILTIEQQNSKDIEGIQGISGTRALSEIKLTKELINNIQNILDPLLEAKRKDDKAKEEGKFSDQLERAIRKITKDYIETPYSSDVSASLVILAKNKNNEDTVFYYNIDNINDLLNIYEKFKETGVQVNEQEVLISTAEGILGNYHINKKPLSNNVKKIILREFKKYQLNLTVAHINLNGEITDEEIEKLINYIKDQARLAIENAYKIPTESEEEIQTVTSDKKGGTTETGNPSTTNKTYTIVQEEGGYNIIDNEDKKIYDTPQTIENVEKGLEELAPNSDLRYAFKIAGENISLEERINNPQNIYTFVDVLMSALKKSNKSRKNKVSLSKYLSMPAGKKILNALLGKQTKGGTQTELNIDGKTDTTENTDVKTYPEEYINNALNNLNIEDTFENDDINSEGIDPINKC